MPVTTPYFSLVVLCYRSGHSIVPFVEKLRQVLSRCNFSWELVLVGNYMADSNDETPQVVRELANRWPNVNAVIRPKEGMMGWDMRMGLDAARGDYIGVIDGDGQFPVEAVVACLLKAEMENLDLTKTYRVRRMTGSIVGLFLMCTMGCSSCYLAYRFTTLTRNRRSYGAKNISCSISSQMIGSPMLRS